MQRDEIFGILLEFSSVCWLRDVVVVVGERGDEDVDESDDKGQSDHHIVGDILPVVMSLSVAFFTFLTFQSTDEYQRYANQ